MAFRHVHQSLNVSFDWYLRADDDAYVIIENARRFLKNYDASANHLFSFKWGHFEVSVYMIE